ncbi:hypothetical protein PVAP13_5KG383600 [Panicum virgatum]|uniref:Replication protein A 70 kDa DNA-binding subunit B/D first OB fold domain-containing protein n=1 Tax=Panicum virgatum TaxID=38727 RepID=A0A8T0SL24_PANVG|nr:hypothetical protein PVAP13_5KG383600 [Panicum virgatum]
MQGNLVLLSELQPKGHNYVIHVRISRMWEHTGTSEKNDIKHLDLVLIDEKGTSIYAEIPPNAIPTCKSHLQEGKIVYMGKITVEKAKQYFKVVEHPYMIRLNKFTVIMEANTYPENFPKYTFSLTPFSNLTQYLRSKEKFLDVIGKIVAISNAANVYSSSGDLITRRITKLQDLSGNVLELSLGGKRALEFDGDEVLRVGQQNHIIAIFVGTLMKGYKEDQQFLGGTSACCWYINEKDIPEIKAFQKRACTIDNHNVKLEDNTFTCTKQGCTNSKFDWKYKIPFIATDGTYTLEFMQYDFMQTPAEVLAYIGHKFTFIVKVLYKSIDAPEPSFEVVVIKEKFGKQPILPKSEVYQVLSMGSTSSTLALHENLPPLIPIGSKTSDHQVTQPIKEIENMDLDEEIGNTKQV